MALATGEPLDRERILAGLGQETKVALTRFDLYPEIDSTNQVLLTRAAMESIHGHLCMAEFQSAGRGRQGRSWVMPKGAGLCLSLGWRFGLPPQRLTALGLACGVGMIRAVRAIGVREAGLKWPNDVIWNGRKLGGILVELKGGQRGPCDAVIGVGLNVAFPVGEGAAIDQPWVDLATVLGDRVSRNDLASRILGQLVEMLPIFARQGFPAFQEEWRGYHAWWGRRVVIRQPDGVEEGKVRDIDADGALILSVNGAPRRYCSGEISLRMVS
jgi:BirA family biotin operon repressor/biotin-[acetyl-CoA-carboxylase] ligase